MLGPTTLLITDLMPEGKKLKHRRKTTCKLGPSKPVIRAVNRRTRKLKVTLDV